MDVSKVLHFKHPILFLKTLTNGNLGAIDAQNALRIIDASTYEVLGGFKTNILHERLIGSYVDMTPDAEYSASAVLGTNQAAVFSLSQRKLLYKTGLHNGEVSSVGLDPNGRYLVTCGEDGKSFAWVLKTSRLAFTLPQHEDYVSTVAFSENGQWIATGSGDMSINLLNVAMMNKPIKLRGHKAAIAKILFLPDARLLSADKEGYLIVWDMSTAKMLVSLKKMDGEISSVCISKTKRFVFVSTRNGNIGLYDMTSMEQIKPNYLTFQGTVTSIAFLTDPIRLAVGMIDEKIEFYPLLGDEERYAEKIKEGEYKPFYDALEDNPMFYYSKTYEAAEKSWSDVLEKGRQLLEKNERQKAKELFAPFTAIAKKNALINQMLSSYEKFEQFEHSVQEGRLSLAYSLAKQYPSFQDTELYRKMELTWKKLFFKAQELILTPNGDEKAKELFTPYRGISEKTMLIQQMFEDRKMYLYFKKTIAQHDYVKFFALVKKHPFLKEFSEYNEVMEYADKLYIQSQKAYAKGEFATARKACEILVSFPDYFVEAQEMINTMRIKHLFYEAISSNNLSNVFSYLSTYPLLYETPEAQALERQWNSAVDKAQRAAAKGDVKQTFCVFEPYFTIRPKYAAMAAVVAQAYCAQLENKIRSNAPQKDIENGIRHYIGMFGTDDGILEIIALLKKVTVSTLETGALRQGSFESWTPTNRADDITRRG